MELKTVKLSGIKPYKRNPRKNDHAVEAVKESILQCGYCAPIVVDENMVILAGHTRYKALKDIGMEEVQIVVKDGMTDEQKQKYRLLDNKVGELAEWDKELLAEELLGLDFKGYDFGFDELVFDGLPEDDESRDEFEEEPKNERLRTDEAYNLSKFDPYNADGFWQMPIIENDGFIPKQIKSFNYALSSVDHDCGIHFFIDDYQFERVWNDPDKYIDVLGQYECAFSPDFSLYMDMPMPMKIWNVYRSRLIGQYYQSCGLKVIPTMSWAEAETFQFCFAGIPKGSIVAVSTIGVKRSKEAYAVWKAGMDEMMKRIEPCTVLVYGGEIEYDYGTTDVVYYDNANTERMKGLKENGR